MGNKKYIVIGLVGLGALFLLSRSGRASSPSVPPSANVSIELAAPYVRATNSWFNIPIPAEGVSTIRGVGDDRIYPSYADITTTNGNFMYRYSNSDSFGYDFFVEGGEYIYTFTITDVNGVEYTDSVTFIYN